MVHRNLRATYRSVEWTKKKAMISKSKYVFIIGAGASLPYMFPSGEQLYHIIKNEVLAFAKEFTKNPTPSTPYDPHKIENDAESFSNALRLTEGISIDKYLNINPKFEKIGVRAIATAIIKRENILNLPIYKQNIDDNWYSYLFQKMIEGLNTSDELLKIHNNRITFITFNYDRSLEQYLYLNLLGLLKNSGKTNKEITESVKKIEIVHVYGKVGLLPWQASPDEQSLVLNYGEYTRSAYENAERIMSLIDVIYSTRENSDIVRKIRDRIRSADRILFMGFGFDDDNMRILGFPLTLNNKRINGTTYKKTKNEIIHMENKIIDDNPGGMLYDCNTTYLLREYLV